MNDFFFIVPCLSNFDSGQSEKKNRVFFFVCVTLIMKLEFFINTTVKTHGLQSVHIFALAASRLSLDVKMLDSVVDAQGQKAGWLLASFPSLTSAWP